MKSLSWKLSFSYAEKKWPRWGKGLWTESTNWIKKSGSNFWVCARNPKVWPFKWKLLSSTFLTNPMVWPFKWQLLSGTFLWCILSYCKRLLHQWIQPRKAIDLCTAQPPLEGTWAKTLLVDARQPELDFSNSWAMLFPDFRANRLY